MIPQPLPLLKRKVSYMHKSQLISDIGSGINFKRNGLKTLLERSSKGMVSEIVIIHCDRLCRFAFDLIEYMFSEIVITYHDQLCRFAFDLIEYMFSVHSTKLMVLFDELSSNEHELLQDILAINTIFICQIQERRAAKY
ncbi:9143_t:CDS:2 [Cetraspora pellucida]|uniref:9143_t:CDS:1 n=1 Tax=Cetraspora pellucida TaxID=1433469 RepID=A0A9N9AD78_9GLOM|nr:9143_t:CDS:2 [Cetraspora pellucida]